MKNNDEEHESRVGRPTKYGEETIARLCEALADGMPIKGACAIAGIAVSTLADWREKYPEIELRMSEAREIARQKLDKRARADPAPVLSAESRVHYSSA